ncbi:MAG TPA: protein kinase [Polyangiales bacterium]|nr:protein kinase [Polyangiales bacterium]
MNDEAADPARAFDGQYQLGAEIGAGALGVVYRGVDERLVKDVAIKVWHARLDEITPLREQYDAEARALTALEHPNLVAITDYGIAGQAPYLIMELLDGQTLEARLRASRLPSSVTQAFMESLLRGLGYMHMRGVVHRNLKPDNVFLHRAEDGTETLKLLDMGLESLPANSNMAGATTMALSQQSPYDSPEQETGSEPDGRSDVYAAGVLLLHMLSGREPGRGELRAAADSAEGLARLVPNATPEVRAFIARAVATERSARFGNADQMLRALLELPTPWSTDPEEPSPALTVKTEAPVLVSQPPAAGPGHADFEGSPISEFHEQTEQPPPAAFEYDDVEVGPIGLMARLRARKRSFLIAGGLLVLTGAGAASAMVFGLVPSPFDALGGAEEAATRGLQQPPEAKAKRPEEHDPAAEQGDEKEETDEKEEHAAQAPEPLKFSARLGDGEEEKKPFPDLEAEALGPSGAATAEAPGARAAAPLGSQAAALTAAGKPERGSEAAAAVQGVQPSAAQPGSAAANAAQGSEGHADEAEPGAQPAAADEHAAAEPGHEGSAARATAAEGAAAASGTVVPGAAAKAAEPERPKAPTPEELGSERHIEPDRAEIRQMLALAVAPKPRVAAKNPWDISMPDSLQALRDSIDEGARGTAGNIKTLRLYNTANPDDVYGHLLLAGFYANRGYSLDALDQYDMAYRIDPSSRGAPEMLKHALNMVSRGIAERDAIRFIDRVYGREAQNGIAQLLRSKDTSAAAAARLKKLQSRLGAKRR